eukprot:8342287-Alexandrium_andersonii.AAC.1
MAFVLARRAQFALPDGRRVSRPALAGVGMGGPIKPFLWRVAFDPVVVAAFSASRAPTPAFVDDVAMLVSTLVGLWRASAAILSAAKAAGLVVELHSCR